jgi:hypothetical protein
MELYFFKVSCGIGMDYTSVHNCEGMSDEEKDNMAWELAVECANSFGGYYNNDDAYELQLNDEWDDRCFTEDDLDYCWQLYCPEKHDMKRAGGGSFMEEFQ